MAVTQTFAWSPQILAPGTRSYAIRSAKFGDGYSQEAPDGINNASDSWDLSFAGVEDYIQPIYNFLDGMKGATSFYWTPPLRGQGRFKVKQFKTVPQGGGLFVLTATFEEHFAP